MENGYMVGMLSGAIAGFVDGIVSYIISIGGGLIGLWGYTVLELSASFLLIQFPSQISINILFGVLFGLAYVLVYDSIPRKGVVKGIIFGLIFYFMLSNLRAAIFHFSFAQYELAITWLVHGIFASIAYGAVLGYLYKK